MAESAGAQAGVSGEEQVTLLETFSRQMHSHGQMIQEWQDSPT